MRLTRVIKVINKIDVQLIISEHILRIHADDYCFYKIVVVLLYAVELVEGEIKHTAVVMKIK